MSDTPGLMDRFLALPRAMRWAALALVFIVAFRVWDVTIRPIGNNWELDAREIEDDLEALRQSQALVSQLKSSKGLILPIGEVNIPTAKAQDEVTRAVIEVLRKYSISDESFSMGSPHPLPKGTLPGASLETLSTDVRFQSTPAEAMAIIADLESEPLIESVSGVRMQTESARTVTVRLSLESWSIRSSRR